MGAFLIDIYNYIESVEVLDTHADFTPDERGWFGNNTNIVILKQPAERFRFTFKKDANLSSKTIFFGDLIKSGPLTQATYVLNKNNDDTSYWEDKKWYHTFITPNRACKYLCVQCHGEDDFRFPGFSFQEYNQLLTKYCNLIKGKTENGNPYFEITLPYAKNYTLNAHIGDYTMGQQGSMNDCAFDFKDEYSRWTTKKCICITNGYLESFYKDVDDFTTDGENDKCFYFNEQNEVESQEEHIKKYFDVVEYSDIYHKFYGWFFNMPFNLCSFKGLDYAYTETTSGFSSYWVDIKGIDDYCNFNRHYNLLKADGFCQVNKYNLNQFEGPYMNYFETTATITMYNDVITIEKDFSRLNDFLFNGDFFPSNLKNYMTIDKVELKRVTDENKAGLTYNWPYKNGWFIDLTFSFSLKELKSKLKPGTLQTSFFTFYFPRLIKIGKVSKNFITLPSADYYQRDLNENDFIFSFQQPGGASSDYNDRGITTTGVHDDYCVVINNNTLDFQWNVYGANTWSLEDDVFNINCDIPLINHIVIDNAYTNEIYNNSLLCLSEMFNQQVLCEIIYHNNKYFQYGIIPPYVIHNKSGNEYFLDILTTKYENKPDDDIMKYFKEVYNINSSQDELSIYQQYVKWYQNTPVYGGEVYANIFCKTWKFRNLSLICQQKVKDHNNICLPTIPIWKFDILPSFPVNTYGDDYCPNDSVNECLFLPNDYLDYKNVSELYESDEQKDIIRLESYIKHIPLESIGVDLVYQLLGLLPGFGTVWKRGG